MATVEEIHRHIDAAAGDDPRQALIAVRKLINEDIPMLERRAVCIARRELWSWVRISRLLMRSRQSVRERFGAIQRQCVLEFESDDPMVALNAAAEVMLQRRRDAHRVRGEADLHERSADPHASARPTAAG
jgi:hypothetical protein